jgi:hypothetical protein
MLNIVKKLEPPEEPKEEEPPREKLPEGIYYLQKFHSYQNSTLV